MTAAVTTVPAITTWQSVTGTVKAAAKLFITSCDRGTKSVDNLGRMLEDTTAIGANETGYQRKRHLANNTLELHKFIEEKKQEFKDANLPDVEDLFKDF